MNEERQRSERRSGADRRMAERRSPRAAGHVPDAAGDRRTTLRRLWYRRSMLGRRAAAALGTGWRGIRHRDDARELGPKLN
jgi:hypothetical protein